MINNAVRILNTYTRNRAIERSIVYDAIIIGAGPVGGLAGKELSNRGLNVLLIEEHGEIGRPFQCAGLVTPSAMDIVGLHETILVDVDGARMHGPKGTLVQIGTPGSVKTHVVCRKKFDQGVVRQALEAGAELWLNSKPTEIVNTEEGVSVSIDRDGESIDLECKLLIGADGAHSWVRRKLKMGRPKEMMIGFQVEVTGYPGQERFLDMYTGKNIAPGFFAWVIPSGFGTHRIGLWARPEDLEGRSLEELYENLLKSEQWSERFADVRETARYCGPIPCGIVKRPFRDRVILIGDAAGSSKPTTGGGIGPGFRQVIESADELCKAINSNKLGESRLKKIMKVMKSLRREQDKARALRNLLVTELSDNELEAHFERFARPEVVELINQKGDIERPVPIGMALLKKVPEFRGLALKAGLRWVFA